MFNISVFCDLSPNEYTYSSGLNFVTLLFIYFFFFSITCLLVFIIKILPTKRKKNCVYSVPLLEFIRLVLDPCIVHAETSQDYCYYYDFRTS